MPFAGYDDFAQCVNKNKDKSDPEAYCASIHKKATGKWPREETMNSNENAVNEIPIVAIQIGDRVTKGGKDGQVISVIKDTAVVLWDSGVFKEEPLSSLKTKRENIFSTYLNRGQ